VWSQWRQFKSFVNQGRIVETSIAVVIGDSFKDVVRSFVNDMLLPPFQRIMGGASFFSYWILRHGRTAGKLYTSVDEARGDGAVVLSIWNFADRLFNFFVVGLSAYYMLRGGLPWWRSNMKPTSN
jgi:large conductance mechanosensitive channel protein